MKFPAKAFYFIPLLVIILELVYFTRFYSSTLIYPQNEHNKYLQELFQTLQLSGIHYQQLNIFDHRQEIEFFVTDTENQNFKVIFSESQTPLHQVAALQKLLKIANIESRQINFVDLSSKRPYATF